MAATVASKLLTDTTHVPVAAAPAIALNTPSTTQVPMFSRVAISYSAGEPPTHFVQMKDGTVVPMSETLLMQGTGIVKY